LRREFFSTSAEKEDGLKDKVVKIEQAEQHLTSLRLKLKAAKSKNWELLEVKNLEQSQAYGGRL